MVSEDKIIVKTKKNLKNTMIDLLSKVPFEKISVSEICRLGDTSRITFYTHYEDKYDLIEEIFNDYIAEAVEDYFNLQEKNNPQKIVIRGYFNMLDCILNLYYNNIEVFKMVSSSINPYLYSAFYHSIFKNVYDYIVEHEQQLRPKYPPRQMAALICNGLWGVINECCNTDEPREKTRDNIMNMFDDILKSDIFELIDTQ